MRAPVWKTARLDNCWGEKRSFFGCCEFAWHRHQMRSSGCARWFSKNGHFARICPKCCNIFLDPFESHQLILMTIITRAVVFLVSFSQLISSQEPKHSKPEIHSDHQDISSLHQWYTRILISRSFNKTATMDIEHHSFWRHCRRIYIEVQTVLTPTCSLHARTSRLVSFEYTVC